MVSEPVKGKCAIVRNVDRRAQKEVCMGVDIQNPYLWNIHEQVQELEDMGKRMQAVMGEES